MPDAMCAYWGRWGIYRKTQWGENNKAMYGKRFRERIDEDTDKHIYDRVLGREKQK